MSEIADEPATAPETLGGVTGVPLPIESANPVNYFAAMADPGACEPVTIDGTLYLPSEEARQPAVTVVPGSLGIGPNHVAHAETLLGNGFAVLLLDPFGPRSVASTIENQTLYSFAASAFDVLAALTSLRSHPLIDNDRIHAQGHSRGGSAVLIAATRRFADPIVGPDVGLAAVYAAYPWCGHQFVDANVGDTRVRAILAEDDEWCSVQQAQGCIATMASTGADATARIVARAAHSFDRLEPVHELTDAVVAPQAPTVYLDNTGAMLDLYDGTAHPDRTDRDAFIEAAKGGFTVNGASIGGVDDQPGTFRSDMLAFHCAATDTKERHQ